MPPRREHPLPDLPLSVKKLPPPEKRTCRLNLSFTQAEIALIEQTAQARGEQPAVLCRIIVLTAFRNAAAKVIADHPGVLEQSPAEQHRYLLDVFR